MATKEAPPPSEEAHSEEAPTEEPEEKTVKEEPELEHLKGVPESVLRFLEMEEVRMHSPMPKAEIDSLSTRSYLDHTVVPIMMDAMITVARQRPPDPIEYVSMFMLKNKDKYKRY